MSKFKLHDFKVNTELQKPSEIKITKIDTSAPPSIESFDLNVIKKSGDGEYGFVKSKYGPLAATDDERAVRVQKDRRFSLNPLLRDPLSVEQEERRVIEEKVRVQVAALADETKAAASDAGYKEGLEKGFEEAYKKLKIDSAASVAKFDQLVTEAENAKAEIFRANERFLMELVFRIAKTVLLRELTTDKDYIIRLAKELISRVGVRDNLTLKINTEDAHTIDLLKEGLKKAYGELNNLNIEASNQVSRGGCKIETEWNEIDASLETQLKGIHDALVGKNSGGTS